VGPVPDGIWRGHFLHWLKPPLHARVMDEILFRRTRFGIDFERCLWWFLSPSLAAGRFSWSQGPSRWRQTDTLRLEYGSSRLPGHGMLYDEVKPLDARTCLGIGGLNGERGDHFLFQLTPA